MKKVIAYVHSHWDREWYRDFEDFRLRLIEVFNEVLKLIEKGELPCFYFDGQTAALEDYLEIYPERLDEIKKLIKEKKLRIGPFYCSADSFLVSGECLCRNLELGLRTSKKLGETEFIGYLSDTFGHSKCIPYILKCLDINKACLWRGLGELPADLNWCNVDVTNLIQGYFQDFLNCNLEIHKKAECLKKYIDKISQKSCECVLLPIGADHLAAPKQLTKQINELNKIYSDYKIEVATPFEYFSQIQNRKNVEGEFLENKLNFILSGVYSSRIYIKQENAKAQWLLSRIAEPLQAFSHFYFKTQNKQNEIDYAYKTLIKNHAHDSIYGCSIDSVHKEMLTRFEKVNSVSNGIIKRTLRDLSQENAPLSVINLSNFNYKGHIKIITEKKLPKWLNSVKISTKKGFTDLKLYNINEIPITEDYTKLNEYLIDVNNLQEFSLTKITKENICTKNYLKVNKTSMENNFIKFEVKNGEIFVTDKKTNKIYSNFIDITDVADIGDSYNFGALKNDTQIKANLKSYKLEENNHQRAIFTLNYEIKIPLNSTSNGRTKKTLLHKININAILYNQSEHLEIEMSWQNKSKNHLLQIGFKLKEKITSTINEDLFGTVKRNFDPDYNIYDKIPAPRGIELKTNTAPFQRFVSSQGVLIVTKGNQEYEVCQNELKITLLRATGVISNPKNPCRGTPAGPPLETPDLQCLGENCANLAISFTNDEAKMFEIADNFYKPYVCLFTNLEDTCFFKKENCSQLLYSAQLKENDVQLRLFEREKNIISNIVIKR
jgi:alpha-mannosidase